MQGMPSAGSSLMSMQFQNPESFCNSDDYFKKHQRPRHLMIGCVQIKVGGLDAYSGYWLALDSPVVAHKDALQEEGIDTLRRLMLATTLPLKGTPPPLPMEPRVGQGRSHQQGYKCFCGNFWGCSVLCGNEQKWPLRKCPPCHSRHQYFRCSVIRGCLTKQCTKKVC